MSKGASGLLVMAWMRGMWTPLTLDRIAKTSVQMPNSESLITTSGEQSMTAKRRC